jgi:hypothetical protein
MTKAEERDLIAAADREAKRRYPRFEPGQPVWMFEQIWPWNKYLSRFYLTVKRDTGGTKVTLRTPEGQLRRVPRRFLSPVKTPQQRAAMKRQQIQIRMITRTLLRVIDNIRQERSTETKR